MPSHPQGQVERPIADAYCPHCHLLVEARVPSPWPASPSRCPHCRLLIGAGRARGDGGGSPGARGAAAGVMAERARHAESAPARSAVEIRAGIRAAAAAQNVPTERLLMVDYQQRAVHDSALPELQEILGTFGSWKAARRDAARADESAAAA